MLEEGGYGEWVREVCSDGVVRYNGVVLGGGGGVGDESL